MNRTIGLAASALLLAACAVTKGPQTEVVMRVEPPVPARAAASGVGLIAFSPVTAHGTAAERRYAYVDSAAPSEVRQAATLFWEEPPPRLVERALGPGLSARLGAQVVAADQAPGAERRLTVQVDRFEEHAGGAASALVAVNASVTSVNPRALLFEKRYCGSAGIPEASPSRRAAAFDAALSSVMDQVAADLARPAGTIQPSSC